MWARRPGRTRATWFPLLKPGVFFNRSFFRLTCAAKCGSRSHPDARPGPIWTMGFTWDDGYVSGWSGYVVGRCVGPTRAPTSRLRPPVDPTGSTWAAAWPQSTTRLLPILCIEAQTNTAVAAPSGAWDPGPAEGEGPAGFPPRIRPGWRPRRREFPAQCGAAERRPGVGRRPGIGISLVGTQLCLGEVSGPERLLFRFH